MIKFLNLQITGFCSIQSCEFNLNVPGINIIKGLNGGGKSSILNAITWTLYGKTLKSIKDVNTLPNFQPKDYKGTMNCIFFSKNDIIYKVIRCQDYTGKVEGAKGGNRLIVMADGDLIDEKSKPKIQAYIEDKLGFSFNLFKNSITFGQRLQRIAEESGPDKKVLFEEAFNIGYISVAKQLAMGMKRDHQDELNKLNSEYHNLESQYEDVRDTYIKLRENEKDFRNNQKERVQTLRDKQSIEKSKLKSLKEKFGGNPPTNDLGKLSQLKIKIQTLSQSERELLEESSQYLNKKGLKGLIDSIIDLMEERKYIQAYSTLTVLRSTFIGLEKVREEKSHILEKVDRLEGICRKQKEASKDVIRIKEQIATYENQITDIKYEKNRVISKDYKKKRIDLKLKLGKLKKSLVIQKKKVEDINWVINDPLSNSGLKAFIFDSSLQVLNTCLGEYSQYIGFNIKFTVDMNTTKKDFVTWIDKDDQIMTYDELSGGEQQLVNVAMAFALHTITTGIQGIGLMFLDEVFESLDKGNIEIVSDLIKFIGSSDKSIFIMTHQENFNISGSRIVKASKGSEGITTIVQ